MSEESKGSVLIDTNQCVVRGCTARLKHGTGFACDKHKEEGFALISTFGSGVPGDDESLEQPVPISH